MMQNLRILLCVAVLGSVVGCARPTAPIVVPEAPVGRVIIYRNGVAYFERRAVVDGKLSLKVPRARVDDFLKSLTVVDLADGKALAISYPTVPNGAAQFVDMTIELPKGRREVAITYVTESPAWKPSYRVVLGASGKARLQSWAVVDNVSGEAWDHVQVGVGSTSALSFRYDLHSVRMVERETIDTGSKIALAPPTGGSPYRTEGQQQRVLANVSVDELTAGTTYPGDVRDEGYGTLSGAGGSGTVSGGLGAVATKSSPKSTRRRHSAKANKPELEPAAPPMPKSQPVTALDQLAAQLRSDDARVRIEGNMLAGEANEDRMGLRRANTLREQLVARGVPSDRIDVVEGSEPVADASQAVRVLAVAEAEAPTQAATTPGEATGPRGTAHFVSDGPITLDAGHSAMVTLLDEPTSADLVYLYDPVSARGSKDFAFNAVRIDNPSDHTLDTGPVTVYADQQFLGEGLAEPIPPRSTAMVPYALDRTLRVRPRFETTERIQRLVKVERGIATTETQRTRTTVLEVDNRGTDDATIYVRHRVASGWELSDPPKDIERLGDDYLVPVKVAAGKSAEVRLDETMPITTAIDLKSSHGFRSVEVYLESGEVPAKVAAKLHEILASHRKLADLDDELVTKQEQMDVLRQRVDELNFQLVTLRKVGKAQSLSGHLAKRMKTLGDDLDAATLRVTELQTDRLTARIELSNLVAELTLDEDKKSPGGSTANAAPSP